MTTAQVPAQTPSATDADIAHLLTAVTVARRSRARGNHPFGALLVGPDGTVLLEAENTVTTERDATGHAETNLVRLSTATYDADFLRTCTLYTSTEPCAMCSGAVYWGNIGRVVYALGEDELLAMTGANEENPTMALPCREVFKAGQRDLPVVGPVAVEGAAAVHEGFWN
ncbi:nucleoside deaminase [Streptomyces sp. NPDC017254]|uniref:nucleoside deaminase n=1 Tax=unclassified Streptomyces TaxID=2593676 RepID=UPI00378F2520